VTAAEDIALVAEARPLVVDLARVLSLAAHIDVALVRTLRTRVLAESDVSTEADLWSSILVESRGEGELVLRSDVREELWKQLRKPDSTLRASWDALTAARVETPPLLQLEERLTFHALDGDLAAIDRELRTVIAAMRDDADRRRNLAAWSAQALDHLPAEVRETEAARILGNVARSWVATPLQIAEMTPAVDSMEIVQALQPAATATTSVYLRRVGNTLEVGTTPVTAAVEIPDLPTNNPVLFIDHDQPWPLDLRGITRIPVRGQRVMIGTLDKRRWWLEPEQEMPIIESIHTLTDKTGVGHPAYLVAPNQVVTAARWLAGTPTPFVSFRDYTQATEIIAIDDDADIALLRLSELVNEPPLELDPDVRQGQSWQAFPSGTRIVGTIATAWPGVTIRLPAHVTTPLPPGTPIFSGTKVICHVSSEPARNGVLHTVSARLIQWWLGQVAAAPQRLSKHGPGAPGGQDRPHGSDAPNANKPEPSSGSGSASISSNTLILGVFGADEANASPQTASPTGEPRVWVHSKPSSDVPREMTLQGAGDGSIGDLVVLFVGEDDRRRPAAVYRVTGGRLMAQQAAQYNAEPTSTSIQVTRVVDLPPPPDDLLRANQRAIASCADVTSQRDTRNLGIHEALIDLLWRLQNFEEGRAGLRVNRERADARDRLRQLFGPPPVASLPVVIELPARISTGGLLGTTLASDGDTRRFRRHQWGEHEVTIVTGDPPTPPAARPTDRTIRVKIRDIEQDPRSATMEFGARMFRNPGKEPFYDACSPPPPPFATEVFRDPKRGATPGPYDLELIVHRVPHVAPAHAYRRGVQFVIAALDAMEHPAKPRRVYVLSVPGCGELDLLEAQHRIRAATHTHDAVLAWIDPEIDLAEVRCTTHAEFAKVATALGEPTKGGEIPGPRDPLASRFGILSERAGRRLEVSAGDLARVSVQAIDDSPIRGYVGFYTTTADGRIDMVRSRAENGVATCHLPRRDKVYAVGAVLEDEGLILEGHIDAKTATKDRNATASAAPTQTASEIPTQFASENPTDAATETRIAVEARSPAEGEPAVDAELADRDRDRDRARESSNPMDTAEPMPPRKPP
jgi:hypothetical protein